MHQYIYLLQGMQLPLVLLIILYCFSTRTATSIVERRENRGQKLFQQFIKNPLRYIGMGLVFNLLYLFFKLNVLIQIFDIEPATSSFLITIFDTLTTFFLILSWIMYMTRKKMIMSDEFPEGYRGAVAKRIVLIVTLVIATILIINHNWERRAFTEQSYHLDLSLFNFTGYLLASYCMLRILIIPKVEIKRSWSNRYLAGSFFVWALLQLLVPLSDIIEVDQNWLQWIGFGISTLVKLVILYALFNYYNTMARDAMLKQYNKNQALENYIRNTTELQTLINKVSELKTSQDIIATIVRHFTSSGVFKFDYAIFSNVNYLNQRIEYKWSKSNLKMLKTHEWVLSDGIALDHHDIMALTVREKKIIHFYADFMNGEQINIKSPSSPLNRLIYEKFDHMNLDRFFIPVMKLPSKQKKDPDNGQFQDDRVMALIEVGNWRPQATYLKDQELENIGQLNLYIDNCAQAYRRSVEEEIGQEIHDIMVECDNNSEDNYARYLTSVISSACGYIKADYGLISIIPYNNVIQDFEKMFFHFNIGEHDITRLKRLFLEVIREKEENGQTKIPCAENICEKMANGISMLLEAPACRMKPIIFDNLTVGYIYIFSKRPVFFNEDTEIVIDRIIDPTFKLFNEKKFHSAVAELVKPNMAVTEPEENMLPIIYSVSDYFFTPYVSIWLRNYQPNFNKEFVQKYATKELKPGCKNYGKKTIVVEEVPEVIDYKFMELDSDEPNNHNRHFYEFAKNNHIKRFIQVPLVTNKQQYGFINIYFKNTTDKLFSEDIQFLRLISTKCLMTIQMQQLVSGFRAISASFTKKDLGATLQIITDSALEVLNADPVILFKSENAVDVFFKDVTYSNYDEFKDPTILDIFKKRTGHVELAELIVRKGTQFFDSVSEYVVFINQNKKKYERAYFKKDFWYREEIKSMAAIQLVHKVNDRNKVVGVMFINYRKEVAFNEEAKKVILTFASLAAGAIESGYIAEKERQYFLRNYRLAGGAMDSVVTAGLLHNAHKSFTGVNAHYDFLIEKIDEPQYARTHYIKDIRGDLQTIGLAMNQLKDQFKRVKNYYRPDESLEIGNCNINRIMEDQLEVMEQRFADKFITVDRVYTFDEEIECDGKEMAQVFYNLLNNAYEAMSNRGHLEVRIQELDEKDIRIDIIDDGKGIPNDIYADITLPFVSSKREEGSGLGLAISRIRILQHGGHLKYTSKPKRTVFTIVLPIYNKSI